MSLGVPAPPESNWTRAEQQFYVVMHHLATVLWMKGAAAATLAALTAVVEWIGQKADDTSPPSSSG